MISRLRGTLLTRDLSTVEVETSGGVVYEVEVPLTVAERLPPEGAGIELRTVQVNREDSVALYGFLDSHERDLFRRLLTASGVGAKLALAMLSAFSARRLAQALAEKDLAALTQVSGVGKKKAERLALELSEKVRDLALAPDGAPGVPPGAEAAVSALISLGYSFSDADAAVRRVISEEDDLTTEELIKAALSGD
ncbi:MAG: Holliday junction branch migration protein RuvA [Gemmatimonadetes bacterium]|nr:Holliday junction branch migration protein RuvA [Gemmatimonadota bacterium]NNM04628.1 Holliday junction branch migration protein RuvA [Gemmatimonadota bacterium]